MSLVGMASSNSLMTKMCPKINLRHILVFNLLHEHVRILLKQCFIFLNSWYIHILTAFKIVGIMHAMEICINLLISICWNDFGVTVFPQMHFISFVPKWKKNISKE